MPNPELVALITCDAATFDPSGKATLYGLFDVINAKQVPVRHPSFAIFCKCRFSSPGEASLAIYKPDGTPLIEGKLNPIQAQAAGIAQALYNFAGLEFPMVGEYQVRLSSATGVVGRIPITVQVIQ